MRRQVLHHVLRLRVLQRARAGWLAARGGAPCHGGIIIISGLTISDPRNTPNTGTPFEHVQCHRLIINLNEKRLFLYR